MASRSAIKYFSTSFSLIKFSLMPILLLIFLNLNTVHCIGEVIYAVNCGGVAHTDLNGVYYQADKLSIGTSSDFGKSLQVERVAPADQILYQTERYHIADFGYSIPFKEEGDFVLVLKFCEVYFRGSKLKVFDIHLNNQHVVVKDLDIYDKVGYAVAHDEYISFSIRNGQLTVGKNVSPFPGQLYIEFIKSYYDNPKINAIVIFKGSVDDVPQLSPFEANEDEQLTDTEEEIAPKEKKPRKTSGPKVQDPYELDDGSSYLYPIIIAIAVFIPTLFLLCRL